MSTRAKHKALQGCLFVLYFYIIFVFFLNDVRNLSQNWYEPAALIHGKIPAKFNQILGRAFLLDHVFFYL